MFPYAGNDSSYPTSVNLISGSDPPVAANFLTGYEGIADRTAVLSSQGGLAPLVTLGAPFAVNSISGTPSGPFAMAWDDTAVATDPIAGQTWVLLANDIAGTHLQVFCGFGDGSPWTQIGGNVSYGAGDGTSMCVDSAGAIYIAGVGGLSSTQADIYQRPVGGAFASNLVLSALTTPSDLQIATLGTALFYALGSSTAASGSISGAFGGGFTGLSVANWIVRASPAMALFVPAVATATPTVYKATGTATYSSAASGLAATDIPQDLTWSAAWNLWFLLVKTAGGATTIWSSPDGSVWTLVKTLSALPHPMIAIGAIGPYLVGMIDTGSATAPMRVLSNADAGVTWYPEQAGVAPGLAAGLYQGRIFTAPNQVAYATRDLRGVTGAPGVRFSAIRGRSAQALT